jgi:hypothetical protein
MGFFVPDNFKREVSFMEHCRNDANSVQMPSACKATYFIVTQFTTDTTWSVYDIEPGLYH